MKKLKILKSMIDDGMVEVSNTTDEKGREFLEINFRTFDFLVFLNHQDGIYGTTFDKSGREERECLRTELLKQIEFLDFLFAGLTRKEFEKKKEEQVRP